MNGSQRRTMISVGFRHETICGEKTGKNEGGLASTRLPNLGC